MLDKRRKDNSFPGWTIFSGLRYVASSDGLIGERKIGQIQIQIGDDDIYEDLGDRVEYNCAGSEAVARGGRFLYFFFETVCALLQFTVGEANFAVVFWCGVSTQFHLRQFSTSTSLRLRKKEELSADIPTCVSDQD